MSIIIRPLQQTDVHFIHDSWRKSLWKNEVDHDAVPWDAHFEGMNAVWDTWVVAGHTPPRATVQTLLARPEWKVEMVVTAAL